VRSNWTTIRFANGRIHQPHLERTTHASYRVADGGRLGIATGVDVSPEGLATLRTAASQLARVAPVEPKFPGFFDGRSRKILSIPFSAPTAATAPETATRLAERILSAAEGAAPGGRIAGVVNVGGEELRVLNSAGLDRTSRTSLAQASVLVDRPDRDPPVSGWSEGAHWDARRLDPERLGAEAGERVAVSVPGSERPGTYRVVLRGSAMAEVMRFLSWLGFGGQGEVEGWSCLRRLRGKAIAPEFVHLVDDPASRFTIPQAIDYEGCATRPLALIDHGRAGPVVTDLLTAGRLGRTVTGHAFPPESPWGDFGPHPSHVLLAPGDASEAELVKEVRRGILVTRFHYVRVVDPGRGIITGMTRDGTYRIDHGEISGPVRNLRFTESVLKVLKGIELVGRARQIYSDERGGSVATVPSAAVGAFTFTSATLF
jgi:PmbA protein